MATKNVSVPKDWLSKYERACELHGMGDGDQSLKLFAELAAEQPEVWFGIASGPLALQDPEFSIRMNEMILATAKDKRLIALTLANVGHLNAIRYRYQAALESFRESVKTCGSVPGYMNLGTILHWMGDYDSAMKYYNQAIRLNPRNKMAYFSRSLLHLANGDYAKGWSDYEDRFGAEETSTTRQENGKHEWQGEDLAGKTLLVYHEQGIGDTVMVARYGPLLKARGCRLWLACQKGLRRMFSTRMSCWDAIYEQGEDVAGYDMHIPSMSLPHRFRTTLETIPPAPYMASEWLNRQRDKFRVGLCWSGNRGFRQDNIRRIQWDLMEKLLDLPGIEFHNCTFNADGADAWGSGMIEHNVKDFEDTCQILDRLDLLISTDTSTVHVAGALGVPVWLAVPVSPDWRWLRERNDSPWYPSVRLFRQSKFLSWAEPLATIKNELERITQNNGQAIQCTAAG